MAKKDTAKFFRLMNETNAAIAAREAEEEAEEAANRVGIDPFRLKRDAERREQFGTLRAREHPVNRPHRGRPILKDK